MSAEDHNKYVPYSPWLDGMPIKGTWHGGKKTDGVRTALVACPDCGKTGSLAGHKIANDGRVIPSLKCPYPGCEFHSYVVLVSWDVNGTECDGSEL
jgi:hypothetical protein